MVSALESGSEWSWYWNMSTSEIRKSFGFSPAAFSCCVSSS